MARAVLESTKYRAYEGLSQKRDIVMIKRHSGVDGFLWIIDSLEAAPGRSLSQTAKIGPAWQTWDVHLSGVTDGLEWYVTSLPTLPLAQIWESGFLMQWSNPEKHLFVAWPNLGGAETIVDDVSFDNTHLYVDQPVQNNLKTRIFQARTLPAGESSIARFATLLIPKKFAASSSQLAAGIKFLHEDEPLRIVQLVDESGVILIAGINEQGKKVSLNNVETSAKSFYLRFAADGNLRQFSVSRDGIIDYRGVAINVPSGSGLYEGEIVDES